MNVIIVYECHVCMFVFIYEHISYVYIYIYIHKYLYYINIEMYTYACMLGMHQDICIFKLECISVYV